MKNLQRYNVTTLIALKKCKMSICLKSLYNEIFERKRTKINEVFWSEFSKTGVGNMTLQLFEPVVPDVNKCESLFV